MSRIADQVEPMIPALRRYAGALVHDTMAVEDLLQDTLERVVSRWSQRRSETDTRAWVFSILHNLAVSHLRRSARRGPLTPLDDVDPEALAQPAEQEHAVRHTELLRALADLSDEHRSVLLLISVEDLSYAEAANVLGVPIGTVMSRLSRARETLRRALDGPPSVRPALRVIK